MIRVGLIGSENSHSLRYAEILNHDDHPQHIRGARIVAMWGEPGLDEHTKQVAEKGKIPEIVATPEDLIGKVDLAICTCRDGAVHAKYSLNVIKAGIPTFVDKPFATTLEDARAMIAAAEKANVPITSFSTIRLDSASVAFLKKIRKLEVVGGISTGPGDIDSQYSGLFFYGVHAVETMLDAFGTDLVSVSATLTPARSVCAIVNFKSGRHCALNLMKNSRAWDLTVYTPTEKVSHDFPLSDYYKNGLKLVLKMYRTGQPPIPYDWLLAPVKTLLAINKSLAEKHEVAVE